MSEANKEPRVYPGGSIAAMEIESRGSLWEGIAAVGSWVRLPVTEQYTDMSLFEAGTRAEALEVPIDSELDFWSDDLPFFSCNGEDFWIRFTADRDGIISIVSFNEEYAVEDASGSDLGNRFSVSSGDTFYLHIESIQTDGWIDALCIYDDDLGNIGSRDTAYDLEEGETVVGRTTYSLTDFFRIYPETDQVRVTLEMPNRDDLTDLAPIRGSSDYGRVYVTEADGWHYLYYSYQSGGYNLFSPDTDTAYLDGRYAGLPVYIEIRHIDALDYTLFWEDIGEPLPPLTLNGQKGPAGGYIFYDDEVGYDADGNGTIEANEKDLLDGTNDGTVTGCRYLEAAPYGWYNGGADPYFQWGADGYTVEPSAAATDIGAGKINTDNIVSYHDSLAILYPEKGDYYTNPSAYYLHNDGSVAAKVCADYSVTVDGTVYDDWYLPSKDELNLMYLYLNQETLGRFSSEFYWSSTEYYNIYAKEQYFGGGAGCLSYDRKYANGENGGSRVRAVRAF